MLKKQVLQYILFEIFLKALLNFSLFPVAVWILNNLSASASWIILIIFLIIGTDIAFYELSVSFLFFSKLIKKKSFKFSEILYTSLSKLKTVAGVEIVGACIYFMLLIPMQGGYFSSAVFPHGYLPASVQTALNSFDYSNYFYYLFYILIFIINGFLAIVPLEMVYRNKSFMESAASSIFYTSRHYRIWIITGIYSITTFCIFQWLPYPIFKTKDFGFYLFSYLQTGPLFWKMLIEYYLISIMNILLEFSYLYFVRKILLISLEDSLFVWEAEDGKRIYQNFTPKTAICGILLVFTIFGYYRNSNLNLIQQPAVSIAHRGDSEYSVENSLSALKLAHQFKVDLSECDVQLSKDLVPVIYHDDNLSRLTGVNEEVSGLNFKEISRLKLKEKGYIASVPTLSEYINAAKALKPTQNLLLDTKVLNNQSELMAVTLITQVKEDQFTENAWIQSNNRAFIKLMVSICPEWNIGLCDEGLYGTPILEDDIDFINVRKNIITPGFLEDAKRQNVKVYAWTIDNPQEMNNLLNAGVNGIVSNKTQLVVETIQKFNEENHLAE